VSVNVPVILLLLLAVSTKTSVPVHVTVIGGVDTTPRMPTVRFTALPAIVPLNEVKVKPAGRAAPTIDPVMVLPFCESVAVPLPSVVVTDHVPVTLIPPGAGVGVGVGVGAGVGVGVGAGVGVGVGVGLTGHPGVATGFGKGHGGGFGDGGVSAGPTVMPPTAPLQLVRLVVQSMATGAAISSTAPVPVILTGLSGESAVQRPFTFPLKSNVYARGPAVAPHRE
jgi:hypothetical protein